MGGRSPAGASDRGGVMKGNGRRILVVEDDRDIRESLQDLLEVEGYAVTTAENGRDALEQLQRMDAPSVILLDLMMPVMSGDEFLRELRKDGALASIPVLVVSAWTDEANKVLDLAQGRARVLTHSEKTWASITFAGARHRLELAFDGAEAGPVPFRFAALTVKVYAVPTVSPETVALVVEPSALAVSPPGEEVTV